MSLWFYVTKRTMGCHVYDPFLKINFYLSKLWRNVSSSFLTSFERFKWLWVHFLVGYILSWDHNWKGGILSETEVTETQCVQSLACLPYIDIEQGLNSFCPPPNVGGKISFILNFKFAFTIGVTTAITIQQSFWILCNKCTTSAFETQVQLNSLTLWMTNIWVKKGLLGGYKGPEARLF
jgi:hypothetical protein